MSTMFAPLISLIKSQAFSIVSERSASVNPAGSMDLLQMFFNLIISSLLLPLISTSTAPPEFVNNVIFNLFMELTAKKGQDLSSNPTYFCK